MATDRHKAKPLSIRLPEPERLWLAEHARQTGQPVRRIILDAIAAYRAAADPDASVAAAGD
jgi:hypothetical protein